jgi:hypothetical protein
VDAYGNGGEGDFTLGQGIVTVRYDGEVCIVPAIGCVLVSMDYGVSFTDGKQTRSCPVSGLWEDGAI